MTGVRELLERYLDELYRWNDRVNLTSVPGESAWGRHIEDSLSLLAAAPPPAGATVVDVGSGAGLPGIPMAVMRPDLRIMLMDSDVRKAGFLTHVAGLLELGNVRVSAARAEVAGRDPASRDRFDVAVSRATAPATALCELALPLVRTGGYLAALVSDAAMAAAECHFASSACGGEFPVAVAPDLLVVGKRTATPAAYPRRTGVPLRNPITE
jgi:16S rRNA (guanine527-N7)-methyltransferase